MVSAFEPDASSDSATLWLVSLNVITGIVGDLGRPLPIVNPYSLRLEGGSLGDPSEAEVTGVEVHAEKIACSLVLEGLYSW